MIAGYLCPPPLARDRKGSPRCSRLHIVSSAQRIALMRCAGRADCNVADRHDEPAGKDESAKFTGTGSQVSKISISTSPRTGLFCTSIVRWLRALVTRHRAGGARDTRAHATRDTHGTRGRTRAHGSHRRTSQPSKRVHPNSPNRTGNRVCPGSPPPPGVFNR